MPGENHPIRRHPREASEVESSEDEDADYDDEAVTSNDDDTSSENEEDIYAGASPEVVNEHRALKAQFQAAERSLIASGQALQEMCDMIAEKEEEREIWMRLKHTREFQNAVAHARAAAALLPEVRAEIEVTTDDGEVGAQFEAAQRSLMATNQVLANIQEGTNNEHPAGDGR